MKSVDGVDICGFVNICNRKCSFHMEKNVGNAQSGVENYVNGVIQKSTADTHKNVYNTVIVWINH